ncbi:MAG: B12-binding domain-containing radical SAM protein [Candidatus Bathyarchaeia archaeon]
MADILLIQPPLSPPMRDYVQDLVLTPPLGLCYIASFMHSDYEVSILDCSILNLDDKSVEDRVGRENPKIVGLTATTHTYKNALRIASMVKRFNRDIFTVIGGPHVTFRAEEAALNPQIDFVVRHEGEVTMRNLADFLIGGRGRIADIKGITYRRNGGVYSNPPQPFIEDLDTLPYPRRDLTPISMYKVPASMITSRGCPSRCIFCAAGAMSGHRYRVRSPNNIVGEVKLIMREINPKFLFIADDTFTVFPDRVRAITSRLRELGVRWICESRANYVSREIIEELASSGCFVIQFGVESGSQKILDSIRKGITVDQVRRAAKWCVEAGITPVCSFMVPHPEDDWETVGETERLMNELKDLGAQIYVSFTTPFPGTSLYEEAEKFGLEFLSYDTDDYNLATPVIRTKNLKAEDVEEIFDRYMRISQETIPFEKLD